VLSLIKVERFMSLIMVTLLLLVSFGAAYAATPGGEIRLSLMMYGDDTQKYFFNLIKEGFERDNPGYKLDFEIVAYAQYIEKIQVLYATGTAPDVFLTWAQYKPQFVESGMLLDVTERINRSSVVSMDNFFPVIKDNVSYQGHMWGTPWGFNSTVWIANLDLLNEAGIAFPGYDWTVDDLREISRKVTRPEKKIFGTVNPIASGGGHAIQWVMNWAGHGFIDESGRKVLVNSAGTVAMVDYWRELALDLGVIPSSRNPRTSGATFLGTGDLAFWQCWTTETQQLITLRDKGVTPVQWRFTTYPKAPNGQKHFAQGHLWSIPANSKRPDDAWKLLEWLGSEACDYIWASSQRTPPVMPNIRHWNAYNHLLNEQDRQEVLNFIINVMYSQGYAQDLAYWPTYGQMDTIIKSHFNQVFAGNTSAKIAMDQAATQMQIVLDEYWQQQK
jgi:ABC-type glycerol-3-phosphate transport system substrate-binding protein